MSYPLLRCGLTAARFLRAFWLFSCLWLGASAFAAQVIYVNPSSPGPTHNGTSWATAYVDLQSALAAANPTSAAPVEIWLAGGIYKPTAGTDRNATFALKDYLTIRGGFNGTESTAAQRSATPAQRTVLSGDIGASQFGALSPTVDVTAYSSYAFDFTGTGAKDNSLNVLRAVNVDDVVLDRLVITSGAADNFDPAMPAHIEAMIQPASSHAGYQEDLVPAVAGGGLYSIHSVVTVVDCFFAGNRASGFGGAIGTRGGSLTITGSTFSRNSSSYVGGALALQDTGLALNDSILYGNQAVHLGGAAYINDLTEDQAAKAYQANVLMTISAVNAGLDGTSVMAPQDPGVGVSAMKVAKSTFTISKELLKTALAGAPKESIFGGPLNAAATNGIGSVIGGAYNAISIGVAVVDIGVQIALALGVDPNDPFIRNWSAVSTVFNTYFTPVGLYSLIYNFFRSPPQPTWEERVTTLRQQEFDQQHTKAAQKRWAGNRFERNYSLGFGGAVVVLGANINFESTYFIENEAANNAGALALYGYNSVNVYNSAFIRNRSGLGHSAIAVGFRSIVRVVNSAVLSNVSAKPKAFALAVDSGGDLVVGNSVLWGNLNSALPGGGADLYAAVYADLSPSGQQAYNDAGDLRDMWIGVADISFSDVQGLGILSLGKDHFITTGNQLDGAEEFGIYQQDGLFNMGEGIRANVRDPRRGNFSRDPVLINNVFPWLNSPLLNTGSNSFLIGDAPDDDLVGNSRHRHSGDRVDIGPIESDGLLPPGFTIYVNPAANGDGTGRNWANGVTTLSAALALPQRPGNQIWVAAGTYYPTAGADRNAAPTLAPGVTLVGGFAPGATQLSESDPVARPTIISGNIGNLGSAADNSTVLLKGETVLDRFGPANFTELEEKLPRVIRGFRFTGARDGTAVRLGSPVILQACTFDDNAGGPALSLRTVNNSQDSSAEVKDSHFLSNLGGAISSNLNSLVVRDSVFYSNTAPSGGALRLDGQEAQITGSVFFGNAATAGRGGAIYANIYRLLLAQNTIYQNIATPAAGDTSIRGGGGVWVPEQGGGTVSAINSIFYANRIQGALFASTDLERQQIGIQSLAFFSPLSLRGSDVEGLTRFADPLNSGNFDYEPFFSNVAARDFRLFQNSPMIDAGVAYQAPGNGNDIGGSPRVARTGIDVGAYEYQGVNGGRIIIPLTFTASADDDGRRYRLTANFPSGIILSNLQWEVNRRDGRGFVPVVNDTVHSGATFDSLLLTNPPHTWNGFIYRLRNQGPTPAYSDSRVISIQPSILYVTSGGAGTKDGTNWANAMAAVRDAATIAVDWTQIWVAAGTYRTPGAYAITPGVRIYGGFAGSETTRQARDGTLNPTIFQGFPAGSGLKGGIRVTGSAGAAITVLDTLRLVDEMDAFAAVELRAANVLLANVKFSHTIYPAVRAYDSTVVLQDCSVDQVVDRAPLYFTRSTVRLTRVQVKNNGDASAFPQIDAGAVIADWSALTVEDSEFADNRGRYTGGIWIYGASVLDVQRTKFLRNFSSNGPGALYFNASPAGQVRNSLFAGNRSTDSTGGGGAIRQAANGTLTLNHVTLADNESMTRGGGATSDSGTLNILNSIVWGNRAPQGSQVNRAATLAGSLVQGGGGALNVFPQFAGAGDYRLTASSPALNRGVTDNTAVGATDLSGSPRRFAGAPADLGAYELQEAAGTPLLIAAVPADTTLYAGQAAQFSITRDPSTNYTFEWEWFNGSTWQPVATLAGWTVTQTGATSTLATAGALQSANNLQVRAFVPGLPGGVFGGKLTVKSRAIVRVDASRPTSGNGLTWATAFRTIGEAMALADSGTDIWVADGDYSTPGIHLISGVRLYGGFAGGESTLAARDPATNVARIVAGPLVASSLIRGPMGRDTLVDGLTFTVAGDEGLQIDGNASPTVNNVVFSGNGTGVYGGGAGGDPLFTGCRFENNTEAGVDAGNATMSFDQCVFTGHAAYAVFGNGSTTKFTACQFLGNAGRALALFNGATTIERCVIAGHNGPGEAVYLQNNSSVIRDSLIRDNHSTTAGAALKLAFTVTLERVTIVNNDGGTTAGGIEASETKLQITDSIIWGNRGTRPFTSVEQFQILTSAGSTRVSGSTIEGLALLAGAGAGNNGYDPLFVNAATGDFALQAQSPAIDAALGVAPPAGTLDVRGVARVQGGAADRGAIESATAAVATPLLLSHDLGNRSVATGEGATFTVSASAGAALPIRWQVDQGAGFVDLVADANHVITVLPNGSRLAITAATGLNGYRYRFIVDSGFTFTSPSATLTIVTRPIIYVAAAATGAGTGADWANAYTSLSAALTAAAPFAEVRVAAGTYAAPANGSFVLHRNVQLLGGFPATGGATRDPVANRTILTSAAGAGGGAVILKPDSGLGVERTTLIDGLVFRAGGVGVGLTGASPTIRACRFENLLGQAVRIDDSSPRIESSTFANGLDTAVHATGSSALELAGCTFDANAATVSASVGGTGALWLDRGARALVTDSIFTNNANTAIGVFFEAGLTVIRSRFATNSGAAIRTGFNAVFEARDILVHHNSGGGLQLSAPATIVNATIVDNTGVGLRASNGLVLRNSILWGNRETVIYLESDQLQFSNSATLSNLIVEGLFTITGPRLLPFNPRFVNAAAGDYRLAADSPAVDAGLGSVVPAGETDLAGAARVQGGGVDMGAYEAAGTAAPVYDFGLAASLSAAPGGNVFIGDGVPNQFGVQWQFFNGTAWQNIVPTGDFNWSGPAGLTVSIYSGSLYLSQIESVAPGLAFRQVMSNGGFTYTSAAVPLTLLPTEKIYVDASIATSGDGRSWAGAFRTVSEALAAVDSTRRIIWVAAGTYRPAIGAPDNGSFVLPQRLEVLGGFPAGGGTLAQRDPALHPTILSGTPAGGGTAAAVVVRFTWTAGSSIPQAILDGFTVSDGVAGLVVEYASPVLRNLVVRDNTGTGLVLRQSNARVESSRFEHNSGVNGGAISAIHGGPQFVALTLRGNTATKGGAIFAEGISSRLLNSLVTGNLADQGAGIYYGPGGKLDVDQTTLAGNRARVGAGIFLNGSSMNVRDSIIWGNRATDPGADPQAATNNGGPTFYYFHYYRTIVEDGTVPSVLRQDPLFVASQPASAAPTAAGDYRVASVSPAIDAGDNAIVAGIATDLIGAARVTATVDLGAYESATTGVTPLAISTPPADLVFRRDQTSTFTMGVTGATSIAWVYAPPTGEFVAVAGQPGFSGANTATLTVTAATPSLNGYRFRALVTGASGLVVTSGEAKLTVFPPVYFVNAARGGSAANPGDGLTWATAFLSLDHALKNIPIDPSGTQLWVAAGTYQPVAIAALTPAFRLWAGVEVYGGFAGTESLVTERNPVTNVTILAGVAASTSVVDLVSGGPAARSIVVDSVTIQDAPLGVRSPAGFQLIVGGTTFRQLANGIQHEIGALTVAKSSFDQLTAVGLSQQGGTVAITDSKFTRNAQAVATAAGTLTIKRSEFRGNGGATAASALAIGAGATATVENTLFSGNVAASGGAVTNTATATFKNVTFSGNFAPGQGGAIYSHSGALGLYNSILAGNASGAAGNSEQGQVAAPAPGAANASNVIEGWISGGRFPAAAGNRGDAVDFVSSINPTAAPSIAGDFRLLGGGLFLDSGNNSFADVAGIDLGGLPRKFGVAIDPGAYEFQDNVLAITSQPVNASGSFATPATYTVAVSRPGATFLWQESVNGGATFSPLADGGAYAGTTTATLSVTGTPFFAGRRYRVRVQFPAGPTLFSNAALFSFLDFNALPSGVARNGVFGAGVNAFSFSLAGGISAASLTDAAIAVHTQRGGRLTFALGDFVTPPPIAGNVATIQLASFLSFHAGERVFVTTTSALQRADGFTSRPQVWEFRAAVRSGPGVFDQPASVGSAPAGVAQALGDVDNDGKVDLLLASATGDTIWKNDGSGGFTALGAAFGTGGTTAIALGSTTSAGALDAVLVKSSGTMEVWRNSGAGVFTLGQTIAGQDVQAIAVGDLNGDGAPDLFAATATGARVFLNNGTGTFSASGALLGTTGGVAIALGDVNNDGALDAVVANGSAGSKLWLNNGSASFTASTPAFSARPADRVVLGDFTGDGNLDVLLARTSLAAELWRGSGSGGFTAGGSLLGSNGGNAGAVAVGDVDGDGRLDVIASDATGTAGTWTAQPAGGFVRGTGQPAVVAGTDAELADLDGDGALDLVWRDGSGIPQWLPYRQTPTKGDEDSAGIALTTAGFTGPFAVTSASTLTHVQIVALPTNGTLLNGATPVAAGNTFTLATAATLVFQPNANYFGLDHFTWRASTDGGSNFGAGVLSHQLLVYDVADNVNAVADTIALGQGATATTLVGGATSVLTNDTNVDPGTLTAAVLQPPTFGALTLNADGTFSYTHNGGETRTDQFVYRASNATSGKFADAVVTIAITNVNAAPTAVAFAPVATIYTGQAVGFTAGSLAASDPDPEDASQLTLTLVAGTGATDNGQFTISGSSLQTAVVLNPAAGLTRSIRVRATDPAGLFFEQALTINLTQAPTAVAATPSVNEDGAVAVTLVGQGGAAPLTYAITTGPAHGTLTGTGASYTYRPAADFAGADSFAFTVTDGVLTSAAATMSLTVNPLNDAPVAFEQAITLDEDTPINFTLAGLDAEGTALTYHISQTPLRGALSGTAPNLTYTPAVDLNGRDEIRFYVTDGSLASADARIVFIVRPIADAPVATTETRAVLENISNPVPLVATDADGDFLTYRIVTPPQHGVLSGSGLSLRYESAFNYNGPDTFTWVANDGTQDSAPATMTLNVSTTNAAPVAFTQQLVMNQDTGLNLELLGSDANGGQLTFEVTTAPANGTVTGNPPFVLYRPNTGFIGTDTFAYVANDGRVNSAPALVTITVNRLNHAPTAAEVAFTGSGFGGTSHGVALQGTDPDGTALTYRIVTPPTRGTLSGTAPTLIYTVDANFAGTDTFTYVVNDGDVDSAPATVTLTLVKDTRDPVAGGDSMLVYKDTFASADVLANDFDQWGDPLFIQAVTQPTHGTVQIVAGKVSYQSNGTVGPDSFTYTVSNFSRTSTVPVSVTVAERIINVTNLADSGPGTLREAVATVNQWSGLIHQWTIRVHTPTGDPFVLLDADENDATLGASALVVRGKVTIEPVSPFQPLFSVTRPATGPAMRLLHITPGAQVTLQGFTLAGGNANRGGAIYNEGTLTLDGMTLTANTAEASPAGPGRGGALYTTNSTVTLLNSTAFTNNVADDAGGIYQVGNGVGATLNATSATFSGHGKARDFRSVAANGGRSDIVAGALTVESATAPWFAPVTGDAVALRYARTVPVLLDAGQTMTVLPPLHATFALTGTGATRTLAATFSPGDDGVKNLTLRAGDATTTYTQAATVTVDTNLFRDPIARDDAFTATIYQVSDFDVLANDSEPDGREIFLQSWTDGLEGTVTSIGGGKLRYSNFTGGLPTDSFTYTISNGSKTATATVNLRVLHFTTSVIGIAADSGFGSLRDAMVDANAYRAPQPWLLKVVGPGAQPIETATAVPDPVKGDSAFVISGEMIIDGADSPGLIIRPAADPASTVTPAALLPMRLFHVTPTGKLTLRNLTLEGGSALLGGAIYNEGTVTLENVTLRNHTARANGTVAGGRGGAIYNAGGTVIATDSTITGNTVADASSTLRGLGGAIYTLNGSVTLTRVQLLENLSYTGGGVFAAGDAGVASAIFTDSRLDNPTALFDIDSSTANGGTVSFRRRNSVITRLTGPWIGAIADNTVETTGALTFVANLTSPAATFVAISDNAAVIATSGLAIQPAGNGQRLQVNAIASGFAGITVTATSGGVSFGEMFKLLALTGAVENPVAAPDAATIYRRQSVDFDVLANDTDPVAAPLTVVAVGTPTHGTATITNNHVVYAHTGATVPATDTFTYTISNGFGGVAQGSITVTIQPSVLVVSDVALGGTDGFYTLLDQAAAMPQQGPWTIRFDAALAGETLTLTRYSASNPFYYSTTDVDFALRLDGTDAPGLTLFAPTGGFSGPPVRHFYVAPTGSLELVNLRLTGGNTLGSFLPDGIGVGGAVANQGTFLADHVIFENNSATGRTDSSGNASPGFGGAVYNDGGSATLVDCEFITNSAIGGTSGSNAPAAGVGGAVYSRNGTLVLTRPVFTGNTADVATELAVVGDGAVAQVTTDAGTFTSVAFAGVNAGSVVAVDRGGTWPANFAPFTGAAGPVAVTGITNFNIPVSASTGSGTYGVAVTSQSPTLLPDSALSITGVVGTTATVRIAPPAAAAGAATVRVTTTQGAVSFARDVALTLTLADQPPIAGADVITRPAGQPVSVALAALLANDSDPEGTALTFVSASALSAQGGSVTVNATTLTYTPPGSVSGDDTFTYVVRDAGGLTTTATITVQVQVAPTITTQPANRTVVAGNSVTFTVVATGVPTPGYQWQKGNSPLSGETNATLTLTGVAPAAAGDYSVVVSNPAGSVTSAVATLTVDPAPSAPNVTTPPAGQTAVVGATVTLSVVGVGNPAPALQWHKDGVPINGATNATYTITNAQLGDSGSYTVVATNAIGNSISAAAAVAIFPVGSSFTQLLSGPGYTAGGTVKVTNTITFATPLTGLEWHVLLPAGWSFVSSAGADGNTRPVAGATDLLDWTWTTAPTSPVAFDYTLRVPANPSGNGALATMVTTLNGATTVQAVVRPDPLTIPPQQARASMDIDNDGRISLEELLRIIELYNTRNGTVRTGGYKVDVLGEDGFTSDPTRPNATIGVLPIYHTADYSPRDGKFSLSELLRVIELYNYRSGTVRTGQYHVQAGTEDGFGAGP